jgi:hypothetical protein
MGSCLAPDLRRSAVLTQFGGNLAEERDRFAGTKGCLGVVVAAVMTVVASCSAAVFTARDVVSTYFAAPARAMGLGWLAEQPRPRPGTWSHEGSRCELSWKRMGFETASYRITCKSDVDLELSDFELVTTLDPARTQDGEVFEYQGPMSGEQIHVESQRRWTYDGTIWLGSSLPFFGSVGPRHLVMTAEVDYPDASAADKKRLRRDTPEAFELNLVSSEPLPGLP